MGPRMSFFWVRFFGLSFSGRPPPGNGAPFSDNIGVRNWRLGWHRHGFPQILGGSKLCKKSKTAVRVPAASLSKKSTAACCATLPTGARLRHLHEPMGSYGGGVDYESHASVLAVVASAAFIKLNHNLSSRAQGQPVSGRI